MAIPPCACVRCPRVVKPKEGEVGNGEMVGRGGEGVNAKLNAAKVTISVQIFIFLLHSLRNRALYNVVLWLLKLREIVISWI